MNSIPWLSMIFVLILAGLSGCAQNPPRTTPPEVVSNNISPVIELIKSKPEWLFPG